MSSGPLLRTLLLRGQAGRRAQRFAIVVERQIANVQRSAAGAFRRRRPSQDFLRRRREGDPAAAGGRACVNIQHGGIILPNCAPRSRLISRSNCSSFESPAAFRDPASRPMMMVTGTQRSVLRMFFVAGAHQHRIVHLELRRVSLSSSGLSSIESQARRHRPCIAFVTSRDPESRPYRDDTTWPRVEQDDLALERRGFTSAPFLTV